MNKPLIIFLLLVTFALPLHAEESPCNDFYVEGEREAASTVPDDVEAVIRNEQKSVEAGYLKNIILVGKKINLSDEFSQSNYAVTPSSWGSANAPIWIVQKIGGKTKVLFEYSAGGISVQKVVHNGMKDIAILGGAAGDAHEVLWMFDGTHYIQVSHKG